MNVREFQLILKREKEIRKSLLDLNPAIIEKYKYAEQLVDQTFQEVPLIEKYSKKRLFLILDTDKFGIIENKFKNGNLKLFDLIKEFLKIAEVPKPHLVYALAAIIDTYLEISDIENTSLMKWKFFTNYIVENLSNEIGDKHLSLTNRYISNISRKKYLNIPGTTHANEVAPEVYNANELILQRPFGEDHKCIDKMRHNNGIRVVKYMKNCSLIACLDNVSEFFRLYSINGEVIKSINPKKSLHTQDTSILYIAWSSQEKRIGAVLQDHSLSFWDYSDKFDFEKSFPSNFDNMQTSIWYIEHCSTWISIDISNIIYKWNLTEEKGYKIGSAHKERITDVKEIPSFRLVAISSLDKQIIFWDIINSIPINILNLKSFSVHTLQYSNIFNLFITAAYGNDITLWSYNTPKDITICGKLIGHNNQVTAISLLEDTPMLISADEIGFIKTWDIRNHKCIQTLYYESRAPLSQFISIDSNKFLAVASRIAFFKFEENIKQNPNGISLSNTYILDLTYCRKENELIIITKSDIRIYDIENGKCKRIYAGLVEEESEITSFCLNNENRMIIADNSSNLRWIRYLDGSLSFQKNLQKNDLWNLSMDSFNRLICFGTASSDIIITYSNHRDFQILRRIKNAQMGQEINQLIVCTYLNLIATSSQCKIVNVWEYTTCKLIGSCSYNLLEVLSIVFARPYKVLISSHSDGHLVGWNLKESLLDFQFFEKLFIFSLSEDAITSKMQLFEENNSHFLSFANDKGFIGYLKIDEICIKNNAKKIEDKKNSPNYNAYRSEIIDQKISLEEMIKHVKLAISSAKKIEEEKVNSNNLRIWKAHQEPINCFKVLEMQRTYLATSSGSFILKIWNLDEELVGALNIEALLPYKWDIKSLFKIDNTNKLIRAFACMELINKENKENNDFIPFDSASFLFKTEVSNLEETPKKVSTFHEIIKDINDEANKYKNKSQLSLVQMESKKMLRQKIMKEENIDNEIKMEALLLSKENESESGWMKTHIQRVANMENLIEIIDLNESKKNLHPKLHDLESQLSIDKDALSNKDSSKRKNLKNNFSLKLNQDKAKLNNNVNYNLKSKISESQKSLAFHLQKVLPPIQSQIPKHFTEVVEAFKKNKSNKMDWREYAEKKHNNLPDMMKEESSKLLKSVKLASNKSTDVYEKIHLLLPYLNLQKNRFKSKKNYQSVKSQFITDKGSNESSTQ